MKDICLLKVDKINFNDPSDSKNKILFENLTHFSDEALALEAGNGSTEDLTARIIDLTAPMGKDEASLFLLQKLVKL